LEDGSGLGIAAVTYQGALCAAPLLSIGSVCIVKDWFGVFKSCLI